HADAGGSPGPILGYSPVADGTNVDVTVEIDAANATETLYAMLHVDAGEVGTWEFPGGPDVPATVGEQVVTPPFQITGGLAAAEDAITPSVSVADQALTGSSVAIAEVTSDGPGWLVIHAQADGNPGPILGYSPVADGLNSNVRVELDLSAATSTVYAMLHTDAGAVGTWEFPEGPDLPVTVDGQVVSPAFELQAQTGEAEVEMEDFQFNPKVLVIKAGTTVKWGNRDGVVHTTTSDTGVWDSGSLSEREEFSFTFTEPGLYPYYCIPHGGPGGQGMSGTVVVLQ
ncbi:MAG: plastocyanin/azurin family copper-binding protein, partial [Anaerolineae bacterium]|nr:plastocyanin/azurin family copper-binding protein [Anaerolineae bacterium]